MFGYKGFILPFLIFALLIVGIIASWYLIQNPQILKKLPSSESRIEFVGPNISKGKAISRFVKLRIIYETPTKDNSTKVTNAESFTRQGDFTQKDIPAGQYTLFFQNSTNNPTITEPKPVDITVNNKTITKLIVSADGKTIDCPPDYTSLEGIHCLGLIQDLLSESTQLEIKIMPSLDLYTTVIPKEIKEISQNQSSSYPTRFKVVNVKPELVSDVELIQAKKALESEEKDYLFTQNNQEIEWDLTRGSEGNGLKKVYVQFDNKSDSKSIVWNEIILEEPKDK